MKTIYLTLGACILNIGSQNIMGEHWYQFNAGNFLVILGMIIILWSANLKNK
jgi:hypothetical protein